MHRRTRANVLATACALLAGAALAAPPAGRTARARPSPAAYKSYVARWHEAPDGAAAPVDARGRAKLVLVSLNTGARAELEAATDRGGFAASDLERAAWALREPSTGNEHPVEPRLLDVVYRIQREFDAPEIRVVSGYRTPHGRRGSNHGKGRAMDVVVPGATDADVARFAREEGFVGVGIYPVSGFVHVDVRDRSYFWVDASGPGRRNRERGILGDLAAKSDAAAAARGEHGIPALVLATDVDATLARPHSHTAPAPEPSDDDDDEDESAEQRAPTRLSDDG
jgi:uncharacterized protein YcbK (DUF882 family)